MDAVSSLLAAHYRRADRLMLPLLWGLFAMALGLAPWYGTWGLAWALGLPFVLLPSLLILLRPGARITRLSVALSFMLFCALHIHQAMGTTELHFGIFVLLAVLLCYRDWMVIVIAALVAAAHHLLFSHLQALGWNTICFVEPGFGRVLAHAAYVLAETAVLSYIAVWLQRDSLQAAELQHLVERMSVGQGGGIDLQSSAPAYHSAAARSLAASLAMVASAVRRVRGAVVSMHETLSRMTETNAEVRDGASRQAAMVQEAVAAVDTVADASVAGRDQAAGAVGHAQEVYRLAGEGSTVMRESMATMASISESSARIADITAVIDGIAFQTNILALNAAVEAARAGPEGKGFSVVAGEVRGLAHRSAQAAKEIRALIDASGQRVEEGRERIEAAGQVMEQLLDGVSRLTVVLSESRDSSERQGERISGIGQTVRQISDIARDNLGHLEVAAQLVLALEQASAGQLESVRRFSVRSGREEDAVEPEDGSSGPALAAGPRLALS
ncbi:chemotaxis protein [Alcaligenaceae bacterium]|nr:chemotaxis protein [Alcaligenaceae bacterium]